MEYGYGGVHLLFAVFFGDTSRAEALKKYLPKEKRKERPAAKHLPCGSIDTTFMANTDPHVYIRGIYMAQCTPRPMKVDWMLWYYRPNAEFYDRYQLKARFVPTFTQRMRAKWYGGYVI